MATKFGYVETSDLAATYGTGHIHSVKCPANAQNGFALKLGNYVSNEVKTATLAAATDKIVLLANPAIFYDQTSTASQAEWFYCPEENAVVRAYDVVVNDRFAISNECITTTTAAKDKYLSVADGKFVVEDTKPVNNTGFIGLITEVVVKSSITLVRVVVLQNI